MRVITLAIFCSLAFFAVCMPTEKQSAPDASQRDILDTLLPIFGNYKLNTIVSARTIEFVRRFFDINPRFYTAFQTELASEGVQLPDFANLNWNVLTTEDFNLVKDLIGDATLSMAIQQSFIDELEEKINNNPSLIARLESRVAEAGIVVDENVDLNSVANTLKKTFTPMMIAFTPVAMQILWFGKRDVERLDLDLNAILAAVGPTLINMLLGAIGKRDVEKINFAQIQQLVQPYLPMIQQLYNQYAPLAQQLVQQYGPMLQQFLNSNPALLSTITQAISPVINLLPFLPRENIVDTLIALVGPLVQTALGSLLGNLLGKREVERIDLSSVLTQVVSALLGSLLGKRDVEKINFAQIQQLVQPYVPMIQQLYNQYAPIAQQLVQQYGPMLQQFLSSNPALLSTITQAISPVINLLPFLPRNDIIEQLLSIGTTILGPLVQTALGSLLGSLLGKRDVERVDIVNVLLPVITNVLISLIGK